jgi:hypothetical protein
MLYFITHFQNMRIYVVRPVFSDGLRGMWTPAVDIQDVTDFLLQKESETERTYSAHEDGTMHYTMDRELPRRNGQMISVDTHEGTLDGGSLTSFERELEDQEAKWAAYWCVCICIYLCMYEYMYGCVCQWEEVGCV